MCCGCLWTRLSISARAYNCPAVQSRSKSIAGSSAVQSAKWIAPAGAGVVDNIDVLLRTAGGPAMEPVGKTWPFGYVDIALGGLGQHPCQHGLWPGRE